MTVIGGLSAKGSPGVSLAMWTIAHLWPRPAIAMEADDAGGTWALRHGLTTEPGLASLASTQDALSHQRATEHGHEIGGERFAVCAPRESTIVGASLTWLSDRLRAWPSRDDLFLDLGRVRATTLRDNASIYRADTLLVFARPTAEDLGPLAHLLSQMGDVAATTTDFQLVTIGSAPYSPQSAVDALRELSGVHRLRLGTALPDDATSASAIAQGGRKGTKIAQRWFGPLVNELAAASAGRTPIFASMVR